MDQVQKTMLENWKRDRLPHFTLVSANESQKNKEEFLKNWSLELLAAIWTAEGKKLSADWRVNPSFLQHPDISWIDIEGSAALVKSPEVIEWQAQLDYRPMELKYKWVIWPEAEKINVHLANKLLKTLEEPPEKTIVLFTTSEKAPMLPTIESRAIKIRLPKQIDDELVHRPLPQESFLDYLSRLGADHGQKFCSELAPLIKVGELHETLEFLKKHKQESKQLLLTVLDFERTRASNPQSLEALQKRLQWFQKSEVFHHGAAERWLTLLSPYF